MKYLNLKQSKLNLLKSFLLLVSGIYLSSSLDSQISTLQGDDVDGRQLRSIIIEGWETKAWDVEAIPGPPEGIAQTNITVGVPKNLENNSKNKKSMGVRFSFVYPGHNTVVITPPKTRNVRRPTGQLDEKNQPKYIEIPGIALPGRVDSLSVWVMGRGNGISLEAWLQDWKGDTFIGRFGSLNYIGWRPLTFIIPKYVSQKIDSFPQTKSMVFQKFVVRSEPFVFQEEVIIFMDSLKVLSTVYDLYFDGVDMHFDERDKNYKSQLNEYQKLIQANQDD